MSETEFGQYECDVPFCDESSTIPQGNDSNHFDAESDLIESLLNRDTSIVYSPKIDSLLEEFAGELAHIDLLPPEINEADFDPEEDIRLVEQVLYDNSPPLDALKDHFEIFFDSNDDCTSSDDNPFYSEDIDYVEASPPDSELVSLEEIESLNDYPTPSTDFVLKSPSSVPIPVEDSDFFLEKSKTFLSLPELKTFRFDIEEKNSGSTTGELTSVVMEDILGEPHVHVPNVLPTHSTLMLDSDFIPSDDSLGSDLEVSFPSRTRNKIFDLGIFFEVTDIAQKNKNKAKRTKPGTGMERVQEIEAEGKFIQNPIPLNLYPKRNPKNNCIVSPKQFHPAVNYNRGNTGYRPQSVANQIRPPGFAQPNVQNNQTRYNQGYNQDRGNYQGNTSYQPPIQQTQVATSSDFEKFKKTNEASMQVMRNHISNLKSELRSEMQSTMQNQNNAFKNELTNDIKNMMISFFQMNTASSSNSGPLPSKTVANPRGDLKAITTRSGVYYDGPPIPPPFSSPPKVVERVLEVTKDMVQPSTENIQPPVVQTRVQMDEPIVALKPKPTIPYPSRANKKKLHEKNDNLASKFVEIFKELHFEISFADALLHMPKFDSMFKSLLNNKEKMFELAKTPLVKCLALADLGASINLMPLSIWKKLSLPELTPTQMILELADRSTTQPARIAEDVFVKVGKFHFPTDFVVVDYIVDPRVPLILGRPFLGTARALIDVYGEELTLRVDDEAITFKVGQTSRYSYNDAKSVNRIDVIDISCEEYAQEVLGFADSSTSGNPTPSLDPILSTSFPSLTPFEGGDFILKEIEACLTNDSIPPGIDDADFDPEGDLLLLEKLLNDDPSSHLPPKELHFEEIKTIKSSIDDPPKLELKDLPSHLEYAFLEGTDKLHVIISKELKDEEKAALLKILKSHKRTITWKIFDIKGIDPSFCTHKILMEDDFKPAVQH
ncbi:reverse transcriptase domain-containing protein [Tanacetum coccineum]